MANGRNPEEMKTDVIFVKSKDHKGKTIQINRSDFNKEKHTEVEPPAAFKKAQARQKARHPTPCLWWCAMWGPLLLALWPPA